MKTAIISCSAPYQSAAYIETLDLVLAGGAFGFEIGLFFSDDGIYQLVDKQSPEPIEQRNMSKTFAALTYYDIEDVFVHEPSMLSRQLSTEQWVISPTILNIQQWRDCLANYDHIIRC